MEMYQLLNLNEFYAILHNLIALPSQKSSVGSFNYNSVVSFPIMPSCWWTNWLRVYTMFDKILSWNFIDSKEMCTFNPKHSGFHTLNSRFFWKFNLNQHISFTCPEYFGFVPWAFERMKILRVIQQMREEIGSRRHCQIY